MSPIKDHVVLGGGQEAIEVSQIYSYVEYIRRFYSLKVTQTAATTGKFEARFFHLIFEEEFARVKGHFGPINTLAFHPDGKRFVYYYKKKELNFIFFSKIFSYSSGGEDGFVRIHHFDNDYLDYDF